MSPNEQRLYCLIHSGYFPAELPPTFTTESFADQAVTFSKTWRAGDIRKFWTAPEHFNIPRHGQARRKIAIVNPINQLHVAHLISENWDTIHQRLKRSKITEFKPKISLPKSEGGRAVPGVNFDGVHRRRVEILSKFGRYVKADIAKFYPSVYTHSIAWALQGKDWVKSNFSSASFKQSFPNYLDKAVAAGQSGQTVGIPIGPDTSRIISELIITEIEETACLHITDFEKRAVRFVDDMFIGLKQTETADLILSQLSSALYEYELQLNDGKVAVHGIGMDHLPEWRHFIRKFEISSTPSTQRDDLDSFFAHSFHLADSRPDEHVILFAIKRAANFSIVPENFYHLIRWFLYSAKRATTCLSFIVEFLSSTYSKGTDLPISEIKEFIYQQLPFYAEAAHTSEVAWLLFLAREINLELDIKIIDNISKLRSSVCALTLFDLINIGLIKTKINTSFWETFATEQGLKSEMWLLAYEAGKKGWWPTNIRNQYITSHSFFGDLWKKDIEFYDQKKIVKAMKISPTSPKPFEVGNSNFYY